VLLDGGAIDHCSISALQIANLEAIILAPEKTMFSRNRGVRQGDMIRWIPTYGGFALRQRYERIFGRSRDN
jgi:hypothetical protein